jgi:hypothetical protein
MCRNTLPVLFLLSFASLAAGCTDAGPMDPEPMGAEIMMDPVFSRVPPHAMASVNAELAAVRALTAPYHDFDKALEAGYSVSLTPCLSSPAGGMGYHYGNPAFIDGSVDAMEPEVLVYEPVKNGSLRLVAVEYIVPLEAWQDSDPPMLFGERFRRNEGAGIWALHVWLWKHNPAGIFADWNPNVTCDYAH